MCMMSMCVCWLKLDWCLSGWFYEKWMWGMLRKNINIKWKKNKEWEFESRLMNKTVKLWENQSEQYELWW